VIARKPVAARPVFVVLVGAHFMSVARRIMIIGPSGSGKSTLARAIGARLDLPVTHLDALFWLPGWVESDETSFRERIATVANADAWVIDGNYSRHYDLRLPRADTIVFLDLPRRVYFPRTIWRMLKNYGRERGDIGPGCPERFDLAFFRDWVWTYPVRGRPKAVQFMASLPPHVHGITLSTNAAVARFVADLPASLRP
jgi:adenylate kinase family enzyme